MKAKKSQDLGALLDIRHKNPLSLTLIPNPRPISHVLLLNIRHKNPLLSRPPSLSLIPNPRFHAQGQTSPSAPAPILQTPLYKTHRRNLPCSSWIPRRHIPQAHWSCLVIPSSCVPNEIQKKSQDLPLSALLASIKHKPKNRKILALCSTLDTKTLSLLL